MNATERTNVQWLHDLELDKNDDARSQAIEDLRARLQRGVYYYLSRERSDLADLASEEITQMAEDFAQDATLRVLDNLTSFRGDSQFTTWAMKIAMRVAISELRRARHKDYSLDTLMANGEVQVDPNAAINGTPPGRPETITEQSDVLEKINTAFAEVLTDRQRTALESLVIDGEAMDAVADQLGTNRNALYKLVHDARRKLRTHLESQGLSPDYIMNLFEK